MNQLCNVNIMRRTCNNVVQHATLNADTKTERSSMGFFRHKTDIILDRHSFDFLFVFGFASWIMARSGPINEIINNASNLNYRIQSE